VHLELVRLTLVEVRLRRQLLLLLMILSKSVIVPLIIVCSVHFISIQIIPFVVLM